MASSKKNNSRKESTDQSKIKSKAVKTNPTHDEFEIEITNRFSDLDDDSEGSEAMDYDPANFSSSCAVQATTNIKCQEKLG